jgi:predicted CopG family antitoxin
MARTTINIDKEIREQLKAIRKYKRETYDDVLRDLIIDKWNNSGKGKKKK